MTAALGKRSVSVPFLGMEEKPGTDAMRKVATVPDLPAAMGVRSFTVPATTPVAPSQQTLSYSSTTPAYLSTPSYSSYPYSYPSALTAPLNAGYAGVSTTTSATMATYSPSTSPVPSFSRGWSTSGFSSEWGGGGSEGSGVTTVAPDVVARATSLTMPLAGTTTTTSTTTTMTSGAVSGLPRRSFRLVGAGGGGLLSPTEGGGRGIRRLCRRWRVLLRVGRRCLSVILGGRRWGRSLRIYRCRRGRGRLV
ncbi:hypothetical protein BC829DRAFT_42495 [Chytridium lagenaria]|nr:hypothetical protein BC829DRAFT_42495 [Chytridium lagenaria]